MSVWRNRAEERIKELKDSAVLVDTRQDATWRTHVEQELEDVDSHLHDHRWLFGHWLSGDGPESVWTPLHDVEEHILDKMDTVEDLTAQAARHVADSAEHRRLEDQLKDLTDEAARVKAREVVHESHQQSRILHNTERSTQRGVVWISLVLLAFAGGTVFMQARATTDFVPAPTGVTIDNTTLITVLFMFGALGGLLSALFSLYLGDKVPKDTTWFDPRPRLTLLKVVLGGWCSVLGAIAVGTKLLVGNHSSLPAALLLAVVFGYSQQVITRYLDNAGVGLTETGTAGKGSTKAR